MSKSEHRVLCLRAAISIVEVWSSDWLGVQTRRILLKYKDSKELRLACSVAAGKLGARSSALFSSFGRLGELFFTPLGSLACTSLPAFDKVSLYGQACLV